MLFLPIPSNHRVWSRFNFQLRLAHIRKARKSRSIEFHQRHSEYTEILAVFTKLTECKGRPFGQLNKPYFGMSDGVEGVQWNIAIYSDSEEIRLGVNLEGKKYTDWPIATFLLGELETPNLFAVRDQLTNSDGIFLRLTRDAWQVAARPNIVERFIGPDNLPLADIDPDLWETMLTEALECLSEEREYRGRAKQVVTLASPSMAGDRTRTKEVSPHLTIWTPIEASEDVEHSLRAASNRLQPLYEWLIGATTDPSPDRTHHGTVREGFPHTKLRKESV